MTTLARSTYINNVKKGIEILEVMHALKDGEKMFIEYGNRGSFEIRAHLFRSSDNKSFSIGEADSMFGNSMNIDLEKSSKVALFCYTFDLFKTRTSAKLKFEHITIK